MLAEPADSASTAARIGVSPEAARQRVSRQRRRLRTWLSAAATCSILFVLGAALVRGPGIEAEPLAAPVSGLTTHASFRVASVDSESPWAHGLVGAEVRIDGGVVSLRGRPLFVLSSLERGVGLGRSVRGEEVRVFVRAYGARWIVESWSGPFRGRVVLAP